MADSGKPSSFRKPALLAGMVALFVLSGFAQNFLNREREAMSLTRIAPLENAPPLLAFTTKALGGFRGLISNALWIRMAELQEEGKYFEMVQLADWITKLQPNLAGVWIHQAWNMAYNISIKFNSAEDRWMWVSRGLELMRDEGLKYNPNEPLLYREIGWFYQHKIGHYLDDAHMAFKAYLARDMSELFGGMNRPDFEALQHPKTDEEKERARLLREKFKLDPAFMEKVDKEYGPLEWRLPEAHAIYWSALGLEKTKGETAKKDDFVRLRRVIFQSMQMAFHRGRLLDPSKTGRRFLFGPNLEIIPRTSETYLEMMALEPNMADNIANAHKNFLRSAVYFLYSHNRVKDATSWFQVMTNRYSNAAEPGMDVHDFALAKVAEDIGETDPNRIRALLEGLTERMYTNYALGEEDQAEADRLFIEGVWKRFMSEIGTHKSTEVRMGLPDLVQIRTNVLANILSSEFQLDPVLAAQLRTRMNIPADWPPQAPQPQSTNSPSIQPNP